MRARGVDFISSYRTRHSHETSSSEQLAHFGGSLARRYFHRQPGLDGLYPPVRLEAIFDLVVVAIGDRRTAARDEPTRAHDAVQDLQQPAGDADDGAVNEADSRALTAAYWNRPGDCGASLQGECHCGEGKGRVDRPPNGLPIRPLIDRI